MRFGRVDDPASRAGAARLAVTDLAVQYGDVMALRPMSVVVEAGTCLAVLGPNGAGKTSLANALSGVIASTAKSVKLDESDIQGVPGYRRARLGIGHLPDAKAIFPSLTVEENLRMGFHRFRDSLRRDIDDAYELFPSLSRRRRLVAAKLSGGEQQMLALARLVVAPPRLLIVDELSHGLAPGVAANLFKSMARLKGTCTMIVVEQFVVRALALADTVLVLSHGDVKHLGPASSFSADRAVDIYSLQATTTAQPRPQPI